MPCELAVVADQRHDLLVDVRVEQVLHARAYSGECCREIQCWPATLSIE